MLAAFGLKKGTFTYHDKTGALKEGESPVSSPEHLQRFAVDWCALYGFELVSVEGAEDRARVQRDKDVCILSAPPGTAPSREIRDEDRQPTQQGGLF